jgi:hypothetical protein
LFPARRRQTNMKTTRSRIPFSSGAVSDRALEAIV